MTEQPHQALDLGIGDRTAECAAGEPGDAAPRSFLDREIRPGAGDDIPRRVGLLEHVGGGCQVLLHEDRRDEQGRCIVVESGASAAIGGKGIAGCVSTPSRSRIVLLYWRRVSRWIKL